MALKNGNPDHKLTAEELRKGAQKSSETRRSKKALRECLELLMETEVGKDKNGQSINGAEAMAIKAFQAACKGDWKAWELCRDTSGQKPVDKVMVAEVDQSVIDEVEEMVNGTETSD